MYNRRVNHKRYKCMQMFIFVGLLSLLTACGHLISSAKKEFAEDLSSTILEHDDPETVKQAVPAYLLLISSMIRGDQENTGLLVSGSKLYGSYASIFADEPERKKKLAGRAFDYAGRAMCLQRAEFCKTRKMPFAEFEKQLSKFIQDDVAVLFAYGSAWAGYIQANSADWNAVAELPKVKAIVQTVLKLDENYSNGDVHLYMAVMQSFLPAAMGGKPEQAKKHFEKAIEISNNTNLMAKLLYAEKYARLVFNRELHDQLLNDVINAKIEKSASTLINTIAKIKAKTLLAESDDYF